MGNSLEIRDENLKEKKVDSAGLEPATLGLYPIAPGLQVQVQQSPLFSLSNFLTRAS